MAASTTGVSSTCPAMWGFPASRANWPMHGGDIGTGTPSGHDEFTRDPSEFLGVGGDPLHGGERIVGRPAGEPTSGRAG